MDVLDERLKRQVEKLAREKEFSPAKVRGAFERLAGELGEMEMAKGEVVSARCNRAVKVMLDLAGEVLGIDKKDVLTFVALKVFPEAWENAPEPVRKYYEYKYPEIGKLYELVKGKRIV